MLNETTFWNIIEQSIKEKQTIDKNGQGDQLLEILEHYSNDQIIGFHLTMERLREAIKTLYFLVIAKTMNYGDNDIAFERFRNWVIALGKGYYYLAKENPITLLNLKTEPNLFVVGRANFEDLSLVASAAFNTINVNLLDWDVELNKKRREMKYEKLPK